MMKSQRITVRQKDKETTKVPETNKKWLIVSSTNSPIKRHRVTEKIKKKKQQYMLPARDSLNLYGQK